MTIHKAKLGSSGEILQIEDPQALDSALNFKSVSDAIWEYSPRSSFSACRHIASVLPDLEIMNEFNSLVADIDDKLPILASDKPVIMTGMRGEKIDLDTDALGKPTNVWATTFNWDARFDSRSILHNETLDYVTFLDGHTDYAREIGVNFKFNIPETELLISYIMQRYQYRQDEPVDLHKSYYATAFSDMGYDGQTVFACELSQAQETNLLQAVAKIAGLDVEFI